MKLVALFMLVGCLTGCENSCTPIGDFERQGTALATQELTLKLQREMEAQSIEVERSPDDTLWFSLQDIAKVRKIKRNVIPNAKEWCCLEFFPEVLYPEGNVTKQFIAMLEEKSIPFITLQTSEGFTKVKWELEDQDEVDMIVQNIELARARSRHDASCT